MKKQSNAKAKKGECATPLNEAVATLLHGQKRKLTPPERNDCGGLLLGSRRETDTPAI